MVLQVADSMEHVASALYLAGDLNVVCELAKASMNANQSRQDSERLSNLYRIAFLAKLILYFVENRTSNIFERQF